MKPQYLFTPGPSMVPPEVLQALSAPIIHHRTPEFEAIFKEVNEKLPEVFQTSQPVLILAASGTGAMEAAVTNLLSPGRKVLVVSAGKFGERWVEINKAFGLDVVEISAEYGKAVEPEAVDKALARNPGAAALFATLSETSTGTCHDIEGYGKVLKGKDVMLVVDTVSGMGGQRFHADKWGVDAAVAGSQKALMLPPGLAFITLSDRAWEAAKTSKLPKYYWDLPAHKDMLPKNQTPYTPAVSLIVGLREVVRYLTSEGMETIFDRHESWGRAMRAGVKALGLELFSNRPLDVVTAIKVPEGIKGGDLTKIMDLKHGVKITGGQGSMKGKIIRISHMGYFCDFLVLTALSALEMALKELGWKFEPGSGVSAAQKALLENV